MNTQELSEELTSSPETRYLWLQMLLHLISFNLPCVISTHSAFGLHVNAADGSALLFVHSSMLLEPSWLFLSVIIQIIQTLTTSTCLLLPVLAADCHGRQLRPSADPVPGWGLVHGVHPRGQRLRHYMSLGPLTSRVPCCYQIVSHFELCVWVFV